MGDWRRIGGGCGLGCDRPEYPCDDEYEHVETGERATVYTTQDRHFEMPESVDYLPELYALDGVKPEWKSDSEDWKQSHVGG